MGGPPSAVEDERSLHADMLALNERVIVVQGADAHVGHHGRVTRIDGAAVSRGNFGLQVTFRNGVVWWFKPSQLLRDDSPEVDEEPFMTTDERAVSPDEIMYSPEVEPALQAPQATTAAEPEQLAPPPKKPASARRAAVAAAVAADATSRANWQPGRPRPSSARVAGSAPFVLSRAASPTPNTDEEMPAPATVAWLEDAPSPVRSPRSSRAASPQPGATSGGASRTVSPERARPASPPGLVGPTPGLRSGRDAILEAPRVSADQQGWRDRHSQGASRVQTFRRWVSDNTSRLEDQDERRADIVQGVWTCCRNLDPNAAGCVLGPHCDAELQCNRCGGWVPIEKWGSETCVSHKGTVTRSRWHGETWDCCGVTGLQGTKWMYRGAPNWIGRRVAGMSDAEWEWRKFKQPPSGCTKHDRHAWSVPRGHEEPRCPVCLTKGWQTDAVPGRAACEKCGYSEKRVCTQCWKMVPAEELAPPKPGEAAAAVARAAADGCRFHPGVFCEERMLRYAVKQRTSRRCDNAGLGCTYVSEDKAAWHQHMRNCPWELTPCPHECGARLPKKHMKEHVEMDCPNAPVTCSYKCGAKLIRSELDDHLPICPEVPIPCPLGCPAVLTRKQLADHERVCPMVVVHCSRGCGAGAMRCEWSQQSHAPYCPLEPTPCPQNCGAIIPRRDHKKHTLIFCPNTGIGCERCGERVSRLEWSAHERTCLGRVVFNEWRAAISSDCQYCGAHFRGEAARDEHIANECPEAPQHCPNVGDGDDGGCDAVLPRRQMAAHLGLEAPPEVRLRDGASGRELESCWGAVSGAGLCGYVKVLCPANCGMRLRRDIMPYHCTPVECEALKPRPCTLGCGALVAIDGTCTLIKATTATTCLPVRGGAGSGRNSPVNEPPGALRGRGAKPAGSAKKHGAQPRSHVRVTLSLGTRAEQHELHCPLQPVECPRGCGYQLRRCDLDAHQLRACEVPGRGIVPRCPKREVVLYVQCGLGCGATHVAGEYSESEHRRTCPMRLVECSRGCGARIAFSKQKQHAVVCPNKLDLCPYGCGMRLPMAQISLRLDAPGGPLAAHCPPCGPGDDAKPKPKAPTTAQQAAKPKAAATKEQAATTLVLKDGAAAVQTNLGGADAWDDAFYSNLLGDTLVMDGAGADDKGGAGDVGKGRSFQRPAAAAGAREVATRDFLLGAHAEPTSNARVPAGPVAQTWVALLFVHGEAAQSAELLAQLAHACALAARRGATVALRPVLVLLDGSKADLSALLHADGAAPDLLAAVPHRDTSKRTALATKFHARSRRAPSAVLLEPSGVLVSGDAVRPLLADADGLHLAAWSSWLSEHAQRCKLYLCPCVNAPHGCTAVNTREELQRHEIRCPHKRLECSNGCGVTLPIHQMGEHLKVCPERKAQCPRGCGMQGITARKLEDGSHARVCLLAVVQCAYGCGARMARVYLHSHEDTCPKREVLCRYGCDMVLPREKMSDHAAACTRLHEKRFPVCDGYCLRRNPMAHDELVDGKRMHKPGKCMPVGQPPKLGPVSVKRESWMMMERVDVHWVPKTYSDGGHKKFFPSAPGKKVGEGGHVGPCISQDPPRAPPRSPSPKRGFRPRFQDAMHSEAEEKGDEH